MVNVTFKDKPRRRSLLISLLVLAVLLPLWWQTGNWYRERLLTDMRARITNLLAVHANYLSVSVNRRISLLNGLTAFTDMHFSSNKGIDPAEFATFAAGLCNGASGIRSVTIAPGGITLFVYPAEGNENLPGQDLIRDRRAPIRTDVQRAIRSKRVVLSGPYAIRQKGLELTARQAVYRGETFWGLVSVACDISPVFAEAELAPPPAGLEISLLDRTGHLLYGKKTVLEGNPVFGKAELPDGSWRLAAIPAQGWIAAVRQPLLQFRGSTLAILLLLTSLFYLLISYRMRLKSAVQQRTEDLQRSVMDLRDEKEQLTRTLGNLRRAMRGALDVQALVVETKDPYTAGHHRRVADLARAIATEMGLSEEVIGGIRMAALIHDIGKILLPAEILNKPTRLSEAEFDLIKTHPQVGYDILKETEFPWPIARMVWQHHERMDGSGYPLGLSGEKTLLEARVLAVADVVEAMTSHRSYRPMPGLEKALEEIQAQRGILYDPAVADACIRIFREKDFQLA